MAGVFKAYDIRGIYGETLTDELVYKIARAFVTFLKCRTVVVGRDMRPHSVAVLKALTDGITEQGAHVIDLGLCSTPMCYYANGRLGADASIMITASHNPGEWNGLKLCREKATPISGATGIQELERIVKESAFAAPAAQRGSVSRFDVIPEYVAHVQKLAHLQRPVRIVADMANSMGAYEAKALKDVVNVEAMFEELDGTFPNHEANPLQVETLEALQARIRAGSYDFGVAFDGDADRAGFVDEKGNVIPMDTVTALIAQDLLQKEKGVVFYDLRSSWAVKEVIAENGGTPMMSRVGHAFIKQQMRDQNALFAGELSGHYYFRENFFAESSSMATICVANIVSRSRKPLSELVRPLQRYFASGEINSTVKSSEEVLARIQSRYTDGTRITLDGISVEYADWWFNVRSSNTEPLIRLNLEAKSKALMERKRDELLAEIRR